jgi:hypothetical protein
LAKCYRAQSDVKGEHDSTKAVELLRGLVSRHPDVADYRYELGDAYSRSVYRRIRSDDEPWTPEDLAAAEEKVRRALETTSDIELTHPSIPQYLHQKTRLHYTLAQILERQGQPEGASQQYSEAIGQQAWAVRREPDEYGQRLWLAWLRSEWAQLLLETQQTEVACEQLKTIAKILGDPETEQSKSRHVRRMVDRIRTRTDEMLEQVRQRRSGG